MYGLRSFTDVGKVLSVAPDGKGRLATTEVACPCAFCTKEPPVPNVQHLKLCADPPVEAPALEGLLAIDWEADILQIRYRVPSTSDMPDAHSVELKDGQVAWFRWSSVLAKFVDVDALLQKAGVLQAKKAIGTVIESVGGETPQGVKCGCHFCQYGDQRPEVQHLKAFVTGSGLEFFVNIDWSTKRLEIAPKL